MDCKNVILVFVFLAVCSTVVGQRQLIFLKNEEILARYQKGDVIHFAREHDKEILVQRILDLNDTLIMMNFDSVAYYRIKKLDIRGKQHSSFVQRLGSYMMLAGVVLPLAELVNTGLVQNEGASISEGVGIFSGVLLGGGAALLFIKKTYFKPGRKRRLIIVDKQSPFYKEKPASDGYISPYIPKN